MTKARKRSSPLITALEPRMLLDGAALTEATQALTDADALLLITEWSEFRMPNWDRVKDALREHTVFDGRNIYSGPELRAMGFTYCGIGVR